MGPKIGYSKLFWGQKIGFGCKCFLDHEVWVILGYLGKGFEWAKRRWAEMEKLCVRERVKSGKRVSERLRVDQFGSKEVERVGKLKSR